MKYLYTPDGHIRDFQPPRICPLCGGEGEQFASLFFHRCPLKHGLIYWLVA